MIRSIDIQQLEHGTIVARQLYEDANTAYLKKQPSIDGVRSDALVLVSVNAMLLPEVYKEVQTLHRIKESISEFLPELSRVNHRLYLQIRNAISEAEKVTKQDSELESGIHGKESKKNQEEKKH